MGKLLAVAIPIGIATQLRLGLGAELDRIGGLRIVGILGWLLRTGAGRYANSPVRGSNIRHRRNAHEGLLQCISSDLCDGFF